MPDAVGYRVKFGVIVPSTNTVVEADYNQMAPHGVTFHTGRMYIERPAMDSDAAFQAVLGQIRAFLICGGLTHALAGREYHVQRYGSPPAR
jgi:maleate cis-trans isomerase